MVRDGKKRPRRDVETHIIIIFVVIAISGTGRNVSGLHGHCSV